MKKSEPITPANYGTFQTAYDFFNRELFAGSLPNVLVTLQRHPGAKGYFHPHRFNGRQKAEKTTAHELALNPDTFTDRTDEEILSTLVHEMTHVWEEVAGSAGRGSYHNRKWAEKMKEVGLQPTSTGAPGGKETGQSVTHLIVPGGQYQKAYAKLQTTGLKLQWESAPLDSQAKAKAASKTKFTCPDCGQNAWGKPDSLLLCGICYEDGAGETVLMLAPEE